MAERRYGPFEITEEIGDRNYRLKLPPTWLIHNVFHSDLLHPYTKPLFQIQKREPLPPPDIINDEEEYEVDEI